jgi:hypothetical protein
MTGVVYDEQVILALVLYNMIEYTKIEGQLRVAIVADPFHATSVTKLVHKYGT